MTYSRPWMSFTDQLDLLRSRGMSVSDEATSLRYLERIGYYRLSAYWFPFRVFEMLQQDSGQLTYKSTDNFIANTDFSDAVSLYLFDKKLRYLIVDAIERIEVAIRVDIAHLLGQRNTFAHHDQNQFHPTFSNRAGGMNGESAFKRWQNKYGTLVDRSKEEFVKHYKQKHGNELPIWVAIEVWDFGAMSQLFSMMKIADQEKIASKYGVKNCKVFQSWLRSLNYLRNLVAHYSRLWNRNVIDQPKLPVKGDVVWCDSFIGKQELIAKPFLLLAITRHFMGVICPNSEWPDRLQSHLEAFPGQQSDRKVSSNDMGITPDWQDWW